MRQSSSPLPQPVQPSPHHLSLNLTGGELGGHGYPLHLQQILADQRTRNDNPNRTVQTQSPVPFNGDDVNGNDSDVVDENEYALDTDSTDTDSNASGDGEHANAREMGVFGSDSAIAFPAMTKARSTSTLLPALPVAERDREEGGSKEVKGKETYREGGGDGEGPDMEKDKEGEGEKVKEQVNGSVGEGSDDNIEGQRDAESGAKDADGTNVPAINSTTTPMNILSVPNIHTMNIPTASLASYLSLGYLPAPSPPDELERRRALYKFNILHTPPSFPSTTTTTPSSASASTYTAAHAANYTNPAHSSSLPNPPSSSSLPNSTSISNAIANTDARSVDSTSRTLEGGREAMRDNRDNRERDGGRVVERDRNGDRLVDRSTEPFSRIAHLAKLVFATKGVGVGCIDGGEQ
ncbi:hypothetical protein PTI98_010102 [Pleurotus ostreatus]|nr:hypothetical protein PTI98_010102 [Pleurotus ostreatus]